MGAARKLKEQKQPVQLIPLRTLETEKHTPIKSFVTLILVLLTLIIAFSIFSSDEEKETETLEEFVERVKKEKPNKPERFLIGSLPDELILKINDITKQSVEDFNFSIISEKIIHIERKHGVRNEKQKDQFVVKLTDYKELVKTLYHPDRIERAENAKNGAKQLKFIRLDGRKYVVFVQLSNRKKALDINTFYIKKAANN